MRSVGEITRPDRPSIRARSHQGRPARRRAVLALLALSLATACGQGTAPAGNTRSWPVAADPARHTEQAARFCVDQWQKDPRSEPRSIAATTNLSDDGQSFVTDIAVGQQHWTCTARPRDGQWALISLRAGS